MLDPIDPANYAAAAADAHPVHVIEVLADDAVPADLTDNLATLMGLADVSTTLVDPGGARGIVRFTAGEHSSLFNPVPDLAVTTEMQTQTVSFAVSNGTVIPVNDTALVQ